MDESHIYWIRLQGHVEQATAETFTSLYTAVRFAQQLANHRGGAFEVLRCDGSIAMEVEPDREWIRSEAAGGA